MNNTTFAEQIEAASYRQMALHAATTGQSVAALVKMRINNETDFDRHDAESVTARRVY